MSKKFKIISTILLIVLFPLGVIYCIFKNLFSGNFISFLGGLLLLLGGAIGCLFLPQSLKDKVLDIIMLVVNTFKNIFKIV